MSIRMMTLMSLPTNLKIPHNYQSKMLLMTATLLSMKTLQKFQQHLYQMDIKLKNHLLVTHRLTPRMKGKGSAAILRQVPRWKMKAIWTDKLFQVNLIDQIVRILTYHMTRLIDRKRDISRKTTRRRSIKARRTILSRISSRLLLATSSNTSNNVTATRIFSNPFL